MAPQKHVYPSLEGEVGDDSTYDDNMTVLIEELETFTPSNVNRGVARQKILGGPY